MISILEIRDEIRDCKDLIWSSVKSGTCKMRELQDHDCEDFEQMYVRIKALNWVLDEDITVLIIEDTDQIVIELDE